LRHDTGTTRSGMAERRRFAVALVGIVGTFAISTAIVLVPATPQAPAPIPPRQSLAMPASLEMPGRPGEPPPSMRAARQSHQMARRARPVDEAALPAVAPVALDAAGLQRPLPPPVIVIGPAAPLVPARRLAISYAAGPVLSSAATRVVPEQRHAHGAVTGAFVSAGAHVGGGFRTVGRVFKRVF
jgi:hypothetical protein